MSYWFYIIICWFVLAIICGIVAGNIGRKFSNFFLLSLFLSPVIGFVVLLIEGRVAKETSFERFLSSPHIFFCNKCNKVYLGTHTDESMSCPHCGEMGFETSLSEREWDLLSKEEKIQRKEDFALGKYAVVFDDQPVTAAPAPSSAADEILKYKQLLDCGAITQEEYDAKKKQLLK